MTGSDFSSRSSQEGCALRSAVDAGLRGFGDRPAYHKLDAKARCELSLTGVELRALAIGLAEELSQRPNRPNRVAVVSPSGPEFLVGILACIYAGLECVAPPFPTQGPTQKRFDRVIKDCRPDCVLAAASDLALIGERLEPLNLPIEAIVPIPMDASAIAHHDALDRLSAGECSILQYTSGTSGGARAVVLTGANIAANMAHVTKAWGLSAQDSSLTWLPHHHDMGLFGALLCPVTLSSPIHQMSPFTFLKRPSRWMHAMSRTGATFTGVPAFAMRLAIDAPGNVEELDLSHVRGVFCGSEPIAPDLLEKFAARFASAGLSPTAPFASYGLAESTVYVAGRPDTGLSPACKIYDDGRHKIRIVDPETKEPVADGKEGEIWITGPSVPTHYLSAPEESAITFNAKLKGDPAPETNWLRTGDLGVIKDGSLKVSGRIKDMIIANGANIPAAEIEWTATQTDPVFQSMAAAVFAYGKLEDGKAALMLEAEKQAIADLDLDKASKVIRAAVRSAHGVDLTTIKIVRRGALPRTTSGKVQRGVVKQFFLDGELTQAVPKAKGAQFAL